MHNPLLFEKSATNIEGYRHTLTNKFKAEQLVSFA